LDDWSYRQSLRSPRWARTCAPLHQGKRGLEEERVIPLNINLNFATGKKSRTPYPKPVLAYREKGRRQVLRRRSSAPPVRIRAIQLNSGVSVGNVGAQHDSVLKNVALAVETVSPAGEPGCCAMLWDFGCVHPRAGLAAPPLQPRVRSAVDGQVQTAVLRRLRDIYRPRPSLTSARGEALVTGVSATGYALVCHQRSSFSRSAGLL
jgi:hypothetical protein